MRLLHRDHSGLRIQSQSCSTWTLWACYSLIETAKANGIEPYACLRSIFTDLPQATSIEQIEALLPVPAGDGNLAKAS